MQVFIHPDVEESMGSGYHSAIVQMRRDVKLFRLCAVQDSTSHYVRNVIQFLSLTARPRIDYQI